MVSDSAHAARGSGICRGGRKVLGPSDVSGPMLHGAQRDRSQWQISVGSSMDHMMSHDSSSTLLCCRVGSGHMCSFLSSLLVPACIRFVDTNTQSVESVGALFSVRGVPPNIDRVSNQPSQQLRVSN